MVISKEEEINTVKKINPHVVILGSGGSRAAFPKGDKNGNRLPTMYNFIETLGLEDILQKTDLKFNNENFEEIYSKLYKKEKYRDIRKKLEKQVYDYFTSLEMPDEPNLYDYLILSLRSKDIICTFNWDPFLIEAYRRNIKLTNNLPMFVFMHGNVKVGYCPEHKMRGAVDAICGKCGNFFQPSKLLYSITEKNYDKNEFISNEWKLYDMALHDALMLTIFGYGAPSTDAKAIEMMKKSWGTPNEKRMEEIEIIDIKTEEELTVLWDPLFTHIIIE